MSTTKQARRTRQARITLLDGNFSKSIFSITMLSDDILLSIADHLRIVDIAMLSMTAKSFASTFARIFQRLNQPDNAVQKFRFLQLLDRLDPAWVLCKNCVKFHPWHPSRIEQSNACRAPSNFNDLHADLFLHTDINLSETVVQLVKRAKWEGDPAYGLPIESLNKHYRTLDGWYISTEAVFTRDNALLLRMTFQTLAAKHYSKPFAVNFCGCSDGSSIVDPTKDDTETVATKCLSQLSNFGPAGIYTTSGYLHHPPDDPMDWRVLFVRYHDLGPVSAFNDIPARHYDSVDVAHLATMDYVRATQGYVYKDAEIREIRRFAQGNQTPSKHRWGGWLSRRLSSIAGRCRRSGAVDD